MDALYILVSYAQDKTHLYISLHNILQYKPNWFFSFSCIDAGSVSITGREDATSSTEEGCSVGSSITWSTKNNHDLWLNKNSSWPQETHHSWPHENLSPPDEIQHGIIKFMTYKNYKNFKFCLIFEHLEWLLQMHHIRKKYACACSHFCTNFLYCYTTILQHFFMHLIHHLISLVCGWPPWAVITLNRCTAIFKVIKPLLYLSWA